MVEGVVVEGVVVEDVVVEGVVVEGVVVEGAVVEDFVVEGVVVLLLAAVSLCTEGTREASEDGDSPVADVNLLLIVLAILLMTYTGDRVVWLMESIVIEGPRICTSITIYSVN